MTAEGLGTRWVIELLGDGPAFPADLAVLLRQAITLFDDTYSRFKQDSLIGQLNRNGVLADPPKELVAMFKFAHKMHGVTHGTFDISVGGSLQNLGYGQASGAKGVYPDFWQSTVYTHNQVSIPAGASVDFGGFGKGWLIDRLTVLLEQQGCPYYLINGGGDIAVSAPGPIELGLEYPYDTAKIIGTTQITKGALAVSSVVKRRWVKDGKTYHHVIDPRTKQPTNNDVVSTYVKGKTALITDTLATILLIRPELEPELRQQFGAQVIIIRGAQLKGGPSKP